MYSVWFCDLKKAIQAFEKACPNFQTFTSIEGNANGDFIIKNETDKYIVRHTDFSVWHFEGGKWNRGEWVEIS